MPQREVGTEGLLGHDGEQRVLGSVLEGVGEPFVPAVVSDPDGRRHPQIGNHGRQRDGQHGGREPAWGRQREGQYLQETDDGQHRDAAADRLAGRIGDGDQHDQQVRREPESRREQGDEDDDDGRHTTDLDGSQDPGVHVRRDRRETGDCGLLDGAGEQAGDDGRDEQSVSARGVGQHGHRVPAENN
ncbi:hypothetical protein BRC64_03285 [Halobacteriales archaeon QH_10_67_22]|nr:MAG: hypothetical protein BRC64_03285 [Halobacteriales archaeon QH_10_67_22]